MQPKPTIKRARRLRQSPTRTEEYVWSLIRDRQFDGLRFRRQVPIGVYVVDFCCLSARLIVEVDGGIHALRAFEDARRDAWLTSQGFTVLRFPNSQATGRPNEVLAAIREAALPPSVRLRLPRSPEMGEGRVTA